MISMIVTYDGHLHTTGVHLKSGKQIETDAPVDNNGKGNAFSPTDLLCASLASCMMTIMGITAESKGIPLHKIECSIQKVMESNPRRVAGIYLDMALENLNYSEKDQQILSNAALTCPVAKSLHPEIEVRLNISWK